MEGDLPAPPPLGLGLGPPMASARSPSATLVGFVHQGEGLSRIGFFAQLHHHRPEVQIAHGDHELVKESQGPGVDVADHVVLVVEELLGRGWAARVVRQSRPRPPVAVKRELERRLEGVRWNPHVVQLLLLQISQGNFVLVEERGRRAERKRAWRRTRSGGD